MDLSYDKPPPDFSVRSAQKGNTAFSTTCVNPQPLFRHIAEALLKMVKLNPENDEDDSGVSILEIFSVFSVTAIFPQGKGFTWKILIFDERASDIVAPLIHVGELRREGVTLHKCVRYLLHELSFCMNSLFVWFPVLRNWLQEDQTTTISSGGRGCSLLCCANRREFEANR